MKAFRNLALKWKLVILILLTSGAALLLTSAALVSFQGANLRARAVRTLATQAKILGANSTAALAFGNRKDAVDVLSALRADPQVMAACIYDRAGQPFAVYRRPDPAGTAVGFPPAGVEQEEFVGGRLRLSRWIVLESERLGTVYLESDLSATRAAIRAFLTVTSLVLVGAAVLVFGLAAVLQRLVSQPILALARTTRSISERADYAVRAAKQGEDELGALIDGFNSMLEQIQRRDAALEQAREDLEKRVQDRTRELTSRTRDLQQQVQERIRAEEALRLSEERFSKAFRNSPLAMTILALPEQRLLDANASLVELIGSSREELVGRTCGELHLWPEERARVLFERVRAERSVRDFDCPLQPRTGGQRETVLFAELLTLAESDLLLVIMQDTTERRQLEGQLRQAQKMEAIGTLAGGIAHDFNNILGAILGFAGLAKLHVPGHQPLQEDLQEIEHAALRARDLVKQILAFSRRQQQSWEHVHLPLLVREALRLLRATLPSTLEIRERVAVELPSVLADATQIHQVVMNLASNAAHAMRDRCGVLEVGIEAVELDEGGTRLLPGLEPGPHVLLWVRDTGDGIAPEVMQRIFDPFFTTKPVGQGTGLGLSVVHGIIKAHHGAITVESEPGHGATFRIYLPAVTAEERQTRKPAPPRGIPGGQGQRILLVDDEEVLVEFTQRFLESLGYQVTGLTSSVAALARFATAPGEFDLIITDQTMPQFTGLELAVRCRAIRPDQTIILLTGHDTLLMGEAAQARGVRCVLAKPITPEGLAQAIHQVLEASKPAPPTGERAS